MASPRITTSLAPDTHKAVLKWGRDRGMSEPAEIMRALIAAALSDPGLQSAARAFAAAREQYLAELRQEGREILQQVAGRLRKR
jgi:hypothetical protein